MDTINQHAGKSASLPGSFNPLHYDHIAAVDELFSMGYARVYLFVRDDPSSDIVPWEIKSGWFKTLCASYGGRLIFYRMPSAVSGKAYNSRIFADMIRKQDEMAGEVIHGVYFACDQAEIVRELVPLFPDKEFHIGNRGRGYSSTAIRKDPAGHRDWMPDYVRDSLKSAED